MPTYTYKNLTLDKSQALKKSLQTNLGWFITLGVVGITMLYAATLDNPWLIQAGFIVLGLIMFAIAPILTCKTRREQLWSQLYEQFAHNNDLKFYKTKTPFVQRSPLFDYGINRQLRNVVVMERQPSTWLGSYQFDDEKGEARVTATIHVAATHLSAPMPHLVFDAGRRVRRTALFGTETKVLLPHPVPRYDLYADERFHEYAQEVLTPVICKQLRKLEGQYDIEIVADDLLLLRNFPPKPSVEQLQQEIESLEVLRVELAKVAKADPPTEVPQATRVSRDSWDDMAVIEQ